MKQYEYRLPKWLGFSCLLMFGMLAEFFYTKAAGHSELHYHGIHLAAGQAQYVFWIFFAFLSALAVWALWMVKKSFGRPSPVTLYEDRIEAPKTPISSQINTIYYCNIHRLEVCKSGKNRQLRIFDADNRIIMSDINFKDKSDFDDIVRYVQAKKQPDAVSGSLKKQTVG